MRIGGQKRISAIGLLLLLIGLAACRAASDGTGNPVSAMESSLPVSSEDETLQPGENAKPTLPPVTQLPSIGERIVFAVEDGTSLTGEFYPAAIGPAPAVILMHQFGSNRRVWVREGVVEWLNNRPENQLIPTSPPATPLEWQALPAEDSIAVFIFDFRGHGESQGKARIDSKLLMDAAAAIGVVRGLPGVDPNRIALIGVSIGADAAVDLCRTGCVGALSLSPGGFLGHPYPSVVTRVTRFDRPVWCVASAGDIRSAEACALADGDGYKRLVYSGITAHGFDLLEPGLDPEITRVFRSFIFQVFGL